MTVKVAVVMGGKDGQPKRNGITKLDPGEGLACGERRVKVT